MTLPLGEAVRHSDGSRGVVVGAGGRGLAIPVPFLGADDAVIQIRPGQYRITNIDEGWEVVPPPETTAVERVLGTSAAWQPPSWLKAGETPEDMDSYPAALLSALLTNAEYERVFNDSHYPTSLTELATDVAEALGERDPTREDLK